MNYRSLLPRLLAFSLIITTMAGFIFGFSLEVQAAPTLTPEAEEYNINKTSSRIEVDANQLKGKGAAKAQEAKKAAENTKNEVVDKLNLDEPLPSDTKKFFRQVTGKEGVYNTNNPDY
jgi:hypothetical protein